MVVALQNQVPCTVWRGGRMAKPPKAANVSEGHRHGSGKVRESVRPPNEGLALPLLYPLPLLYHAALSLFPA